MDSEFVNETPDWPLLYSAPVDVFDAAHVQPVLEKAMSGDSLLKRGITAAELPTFLKHTHRLVGGKHVITVYGRHEHVDY